MNTDMSKAGNSLLGDIFWLTFSLTVMLFVIYDTSKLWDMSGVFDPTIFTHNKDILISIVWLPPVLFIGCYIALIVQIKFRLYNSSKGLPYYVIFTNPEKYQQYTIKIGMVITLFTLSVSILSSFYLIKNDEVSTLKGFLANSSFINMFSQMFIASWSLIITLVVMRRQQSDINGFERFLKEITLELHRKKKILSDSHDDEFTKSEYLVRIYIVDFHPFIGIKSLGKESRLVKKYASTLNRVAIEERCEIIIICHTKEKIARLFEDQDHEYIAQELDDLGKKPAVKIWRTDEIGPYHFTILDDEAIEYLVVPKSESSNENMLLATKTFDKTKIDFLIKTANDIISSSIRPISKGQESIDLTLYNEKVLVEPKTKQLHANGIKLRFVFEEKEVYGLSLINIKKGFFPQDVNDKAYEFNGTENGILLEKVKKQKNGSKKENNSNDLTLVQLWTGKKEKPIELFTFDDKVVYLPNRTIERKNIDSSYLKIKLCCNGFESEYSYKTRIFLWEKQ